MLISSRILILSIIWILFFSCLSAVATQERAESNSVEPVEDEVQRLLDELESSDLLVACDAAESLADYWEYPGVIEALICSLDMRDYPINLSAQYALTRIGLPAGSYLMEATLDENLCSGAIYALTYMPSYYEGAGDRIITMLNSGEYDESQWHSSISNNCLLFLIVWGDQGLDATEGVTSSLFDEERYVRVNAAKALSELGYRDNEVHSLLESSIDAFKDEEDVYYAFKAAAYLSPDTSDFISYIESSIPLLSPRERLWAAACLFLEDQTKTAELLLIIEMLDFPEQPAAIDAAEALGLIGAPACVALPRLEEMAEDLIYGSGPESTIRTAIERIQAQIRNNN